ncbi:hypothetical protein COCNU_03G004630 [Cocos nucifera]|uniref:Uncharacterized protein n=1 Tax=Cocos nucifera TaxID=13894 RepID=A0A8K0I2M4_COCNU|nr:hypothetical protein COCNU_03G004630 [Cocos nucifera]
MGSTSWRCGLCRRLQRGNDGKQLSERMSERRRRPPSSPSSSFPRGLTGVDRRALGESRLRRRRWRMAAIRSSAGLDGGDAERKSREKLMWRWSASSVEIRRPARQISSLTASPQRPQTHRPLYRSRTRAMYAGVHSSVSPQHSQFANSTSICPPPFPSAAAVIATVSPPLRTFADISSDAKKKTNKAPNQNQTLFDSLSLLPDSFGKRTPTRTSGYSVSKSLTIRVKEESLSRLRYRSSQTMKLSLSSPISTAVAAARSFSRPTSPARDISGSKAPLSLYISISLTDSE